MVMLELKVDVLLVVVEEEAVVSVLLEMPLVVLVVLLVSVTMVMVVEAVDNVEILHTDQIFVLQHGHQMVQHQVKMDM
tara:strand:+ start:251 stop:484 length:234 start_codon:yes stop_codon:yes gene_type:complete